MREEANTAADCAIRETAERRRPVRRPATAIDTVTQMIVRFGKR